MSDSHDLKYGVCPNCQKEMRVDVRAEHVTRWDSDDGMVSGNDRFWILECRGCERTFFGHGSTFSENIDHKYDPATGEWNMYHPETKTFYPKTLSRQKPNWLTTYFDFREVSWLQTLNEVYAALDNSLPTLAAIGMRTTFDVLAVELGASDSSFAEKLEFLRSKAHITGRDRDYLQILTDAGSSAAHRSWKPKPDELNTMIELLENTIQRAVILPKKVEKLGSNLPKRNSYPA
ncbi:DUF4145 domain-containing protein [Tateyamaria sp. SN6-1]|uniref:DUF4145 domain-containing protein n=1 Tax=Tateyamaria sp. SN6-1 TaxID=3092148 RepID=UPI0039F601D6